MDWKRPEIPLIIMVTAWIIDVILKFARLYSPMQLDLLSVFAVRFTGDPTFLPL